MYVHVVYLIILCILVEHIMLDLEAGNFYICLIRYLTFVIWSLWLLFFVFAKRSVCRNEAKRIFLFRNISYKSEIYVQTTEHERKGIPGSRCFDD